MLRATFLLKKPAPRGSATKIGNDPARVCAALKLIRYDSQGDRSLSWLAGRDGKSSADGLGQASSNAHCSRWRVAMFDKPQRGLVQRFDRSEHVPQCSGCLRPETGHRRIKHTMGPFSALFAIGDGAGWYLQRLCGIVRFMLAAYARERAGPHIVQRGMAPEATHAGAEQSWQVWEEKRGLTLAAQLMHKGCAKDGVKDYCGCISTKGRETASGQPALTQSHSRPTATCISDRS